jgi:hypothetical protein
VTAEPGTRQPLAVFCAAVDDITGDLCTRIFCDGQHAADGLDAWHTTTDTNSGYAAHRTAGEAACDACRAACSAYQRARYAKDSSDVKARQAARQAARTRLVDAHRDEYRRYYAEELARLRETP